jgi:hypothetical protein
VRKSGDVQEWSLSSARRANAGAILGAVLVITGGVILLGSLFLPWERVDLQELFGADVPVITFRGISTGIGQVAGVLAVASAAAGALYLVMRSTRLVVALMALAGSVGMGILTLIGLFGGPAPGVLVGLGGAVMSIVGGVLATAAAARSGEP